MVFYGIGGSSVAYNGGIVRARSFEPYTATVMYNPDSNYSSYTAHSSISASAYDKNGTYVYSAVVPKYSSVDMVVPASGRVVVFNNRPAYARWKYSSDGMVQLSSSTFADVTSLHSAGYQSAVYQSQPNQANQSIVVSGWENNLYTASSVNSWTAYSNDDRDSKMVLGMSASSLPYVRKINDGLTPVFESGNRDLWSYKRIEAACYGVSRSSNAELVTVWAPLTGAGRDSLFSFYLPPSSSGMEKRSGYWSTGKASVGANFSYFYARTINSRAIVSPMQWYFSGYAL